jgi:hypothetical protein
LKREVFSATSLEGRFDNFAHHPGQKCIIQNGAIRDRTHTAGVWPRIVLTNSFVISRGRHQAKVLAVGKQKQ